jgi:hypothetical protein
VAYTRKPCPGCGEVHHYRPADEICGQCAQLIKDGRTWREEQKALAPKEKLFMCSIAPHAYISYGRGESGKRGQIALMALIQALSRPGSRDEQWRINQQDTPQVIKSMPRQMYDWLRIVRMNPKHAELLNELDEAIHAISRDSYARGKQYGTSLIASLARGETSIEEWNKATIQGAEQ